MHPNVGKGTYARTHDHVIYSSRLSSSEQQHHAAVSDQIKHTDKGQLIVFKSATYLPLNYVPPRVQLSKEDTSDTKSISEPLTKQRIW
jgi:hypothetical protein